MDLRQLEIFTKVAELGSFSRAAEALHLTQPTVSEHIRALEDELGVRLLDRLGRGADVTQAGRLLLSHASRMLALAREARQALDAFQGRMSGELVVGGSTIRASTSSRHPGALQGEVPGHLHHLAHRRQPRRDGLGGGGRVELAVVGARLPQRGLEFRELLPDEEVVVAPAGHPWTGRR
jgi:DNA-binding transcriptional LysR family regulator